MHGPMITTDQPYEYNVKCIRMTMYNVVVRLVYIDRKSNRRSD